jgi:hypothetical protein
MCTNLLNTIFSRNMRYDIVSTYDTLIFPLFINYLSCQHFYGPRLHDTSYDTQWRSQALGNGGLGLGRASKILCYL